MKILLSFVLILCHTLSFSQQLEEKYESSEIFISLFDEIQIRESIKYETIYYEGVRGSTSQENDMPKLYSRHIKYKLHNDQIVSLDVYHDTIILFNELIVNNAGMDSILSCGELKIAENKYDLQEFNFLTVDHQDSLFIDTLFHLIPSGLWNCNIDSFSHGIGHYKNGKKNGTWYTVNSKYNRSKIKPYLRSIDYENGKKVSEQDIDISRTGFKKENLFGEWYGVSTSIRDMYNAKEDKLTLFFVRDSTKKKRSSAGPNTYDYLNLKVNNNLDVKTSYRCAVGVKNPKNIKHEWGLDEKGYITIDGYKWKVEYLTDKELIISIGTE
ncbi:MAG: hypothetical protein WED10_13835 [Brumimicrobium sp.]